MGGIAFLDYLNSEVSFLDEKKIINQAAPVEEGDTVVGSVPISLRKMHTVGMLLEKAVDERVLQMKYAPTEDVFNENSSFSTELHELKDKSEMIRSLFWVCIKEEFNLWKPGVSIGIRKDWQLVTFKGKNKGITDLIKRMMDDDV